MSKIATSFKQTRPEGRWDAIIIGSGMGGLTVAAILAKQDYRCLVLEKHYTPGGYTHVFKRKEYEWDVGIHYIGEVHNPDTLMRQFFDYITDGKLHWAEMDEVYDRIIFGEETYDFVKGVSNWIAKLKTYFPAPEDHRAIDEYVNLVFASSRAAKNFYLEKAIPKWQSWLAGSLLRMKYKKYSDQTTLEVLKNLTSNKKLIGVLCGQYGDYGLTPSQSSFAMHASVVKHYFKGGAYPVGGSARIAETIVPLIEKAGGKVFVNAEVTEILVENGKATGVKMADGQELVAERIISSAGIINTYHHLVKPEVAKANKLDQLAEKVEPSASHVCLYVGLKHTAEELDLGTTNYWIYPNNYDHDQNVADFLADPDHTPFPVTYISFPSAKDPDWLNRYPGKSTIEIITIAPYQWFKKFEDKRWKHRGEEYDMIKHQFSERLLEELYKVKPQLKGKIDYHELSSPLSTRHFCNYQQGEIYGISHTPDRFKLREIRAQTPIENLYLTGQDLVTAGIGGALFGGVITASAFLNKNIVKTIMKEREAAAV